jgi:hypothetical protein
MNCKIPLKSSLIEKYHLKVVEEMTGEFLMKIFLSRYLSTEQLLRNCLVTDCLQCQQSTTSR